jgi:hypothetical protein
MRQPQSLILQLLRQMQLCWLWRLPAQCLACLSLLTSPLLLQQQAQPRLQQLHLAWTLPQLRLLVQLLQQPLWQTLMMLRLQQRVQWPACSTAQPCRTVWRLRGMQLQQEAAQHRLQAMRQPLLPFLQLHSLRGHPQLLHLRAQLPLSVVQESSTVAAVALRMAAAVTLIVPAAVAWTGT